MALSKPVTTTPRRSSAGGAGLWLGLAVLVLLVVATALPAVVLFLPSLLVMLTEHDHSRPLTRSVVLFGLAGAWNTLALLWKFGGMGLSGWSATSWIIALDTHHLALAWAAQGGGWLLAECLGIMLTHISDTRMREVDQQAQLRKAELRAEWSKPSGP